MDEIRLQKIGDAPVASDGYSLVANSVASDGSLLFLFVEPAAATAVTETYEQGFGIFPRATMDEPKRFRLARARTDGLVETIELPKLDVTFPLFDAFPDGRILIVAQRSEWRGERDYDRNGIIFYPKTRMMSRILLGDGINRVYVDSLGRIWVAYSDEGIFGNFGWGRPGPTPIGAAGLACFSDSGQKIWEYPEDALLAISDCYALNVSGPSAAAYFYDDFPLCTVSGEFELGYWRTDLRGCNEFAMSDTKALFSCQYGERQDIVYLGDFEAGEFCKVKKVRVVMPDGSSIRPVFLLGRGKHLYFFDDLSAYRVSLD